MVPGIFRDYTILLKEYLTLMCPGANGRRTDRMSSLLSEDRELKIDEKQGCFISLQVENRPGASTV